jgi:hypothetical protein
MDGVEKKLSDERTFSRIECCQMNRLSEMSNFSATTYSPQGLVEIIGTNTKKITGKIERTPEGQKLRLQKISSMNMVGAERFGDSDEVVVIARTLMPKPKQRM